MSGQGQRQDLELLEEIVLGSARGGKKGAFAEPLVITPVRGLVEADLELLQNPPEVAAPPVGLKALRHSHHHLARLLASGRSEQEASLLTGYSASYISSLKGGKDFQDLLAYYHEQKEEIFVDALERMKVLGLSTLDELQRRMEENPDDFTKQQLLEMTELLLIKGQPDAPGRNRRGQIPGQIGGTPQIAIAVNFGPQGGQMPPSRGQVIDAQASFIREEDLG